MQSLCTCILCLTTRLKEGQEELQQLIYRFPALSCVSAKQDAIRAIFSEQCNSPSASLSSHLINQNDIHFHNFRVFWRNHRTPSTSVVPHVLPHNLFISWLFLSRVCAQRTMQCTDFESLGPTVEVHFCCCFKFMCLTVKLMIQLFIIHRGIALHINNITKATQNLLNINYPDLMLSTALVCVLK